MRHKTIKMTLRYTHLSPDKTAPEKKNEARLVVPKIALIDLNLVRPNPAEPRKTLNEEGLRQLADSIRRHGLLNPIVVGLEQDGKSRSAVC